MNQNDKRPAQPFVNTGKCRDITAGGRRWMRLAIRTHVLTEQDHLCDVVRRYAQPYLREGDLLFLSEKAAACTQKRAIPLSAIHPRPLARILSRFVRKTPCGIGLGMPETMEMALQECGTGRILAAAAAGAIGRLLGRRGWFYRIAGRKASAIDGPCSYTLPPYNRCVVLSPEAPDLLAEAISMCIRCPVAVIDVNDLGAEILGVWPKETDRELLRSALRDNPLGQGSQQTPLGILRPIKPENDE